MPPISADQVSSIVGAGFDLLREAANLTSGRDPNYIRDAQPANVIDAIALAAARQGCRRYQQKGGDYSGRRAARVERACRPYLDSLEPGLGPEIELPLRGGQCAAVYVVQITVSTNGSAPTVISRRALGPIRGTVVEQSGTGFLGVYLLADGMASGTQNSCGPVAFTGTGRYLLTSAGTAADARATASITSITPCGANNCGNPPPVFTPPKAPATPLPPGPRPFIRSPDIDVDIDVTINPDFSINIDVGTGPITIDPFGDPSAPPDGGGDPGNPTDPGSPGTGVPTGSGGEALGQAPPGSELVGLLVTVTGAPGDANKFDNNSKQPYRGIGYIRMGYPARLGLDITGGTVISPQFFHAPQRGLTNWAVAANIGFNLSVVPYYRSIES